MAVLKRITPTKPQSELGFGNRVTTAGRTMNPNGSFNVRRQTNGVFDNAYFHLITMPLWRFLVLILLFYVGVNAFFASLYMAVGIEQLGGMQSKDAASDFLAVFFFSSQTLTTVGYGHINPQDLGASIIASFESLVGLLSFALVSGLLYGRFSRPSAKVMFSEKMIFAPYKGGTGLMLRMVNTRKSEMIEAEARLNFAYNQTDPDTGETQRRFFNLELELDRIIFFAFSWTIVHVIDEKSPLWGLSIDDLREGNAEIMVMVKGIDEGTEQVIHARRSYIAEELVEKARFKPIMERKDGSQNVIIHSEMVSDYEVV